MGVCEFTRQSDYYYPTDEDAVMMPDHQQHLVITGSWCRKLPVAENALW